MLKNMIRIVLTVLTVTWMVAIFGFSSQEGAESASLSGRVSYDVAKASAEIREKVTGEDVTESVVKACAKAIEYPIRKCAHMTEYAITALLLYITLSSYGVVRRRVLYVLGIAFVYASSDEIHQLYVPDRAGKFTDVLVDMTGVCLMLIAIHIVRKIAGRIAKKHRLEEKR